MFLAQGPPIIAFAARSRTPAMYGLTDLVRTGGLMGYGINLSGVYRHGASYLDRILKGAKLADLPIEQPTKFEFVINLKTAKALGLTIPRRCSRGRLRRSSSSGPTEPSLLAPSACSLRRSVPRPSRREGLDARPSSARRSRRRAGRLR
jgi:ABC transporter substrate binding protein